MTNQLTNRTRALIAGLAAAMSACVTFGVAFALGYQPNFTLVPLFLVTTVALNVYLQKVAY